MRAHTPLSSGRRLPLGALTYSLARLHTSPRLTHAHSPPQGGVYLWEHGLPAAPVAGHNGLTTERRHLLHDEVLEVVAIGG
jgi:hypothetical protein